MSLEKTPQEIEGWANPPGSRGITEREEAYAAKILKAKVVKKGIWRGRRSAMIQDAF